MFCLDTSSRGLCFFFFFFNDTATTEIYTLSLHDALPISLHHHNASGIIGEVSGLHERSACGQRQGKHGDHRIPRASDIGRSEEHTSELQSLAYLVCRLLLEKKKKNKNAYNVQSHHQQ